MVNPSPRLRAIPVNEEALLGVVRQMAHVYGWRTYHTHDSRRSEPGFPDLVMVRPPRVIFVELKTEKASPGRLQAEWLSDLGAVTDVEVYVWRPSDLWRDTDGHSEIERTLWK